MGTDQILKAKKNYVMPVCMFATVILVLLTAQVRHGYLIYDVGISWGAFFLVSYLMMLRNRNSAIKIAMTFIGSIISLYLFAGILEGFYLLAVPNFVFMILGCVSAYLFFSSRVAIKIIVVIVPLLLISLYIYKFGELWLNYVNFRTFTGRVEIKADAKQQNWTSYITNKEVVDTVDDKIVVLDFYITSCGLCVKGFPTLQKLYEKYKDNTHVSINSVNVHLPTDKEGQAVQMVRKKNFTFPVLLGADSLGSVMGITGYPTVFVLQHDSILFRGTLEGVEAIINERLKQSK